MQGSRGNDKAPCDKCNLVAPEEKSAICGKCKKREHLSCMQNPPQDPKNWLCENCSASFKSYGTGKSIQIQTISFEDVEKDDLQVEVNKSGKTSWKLPAICQDSKRDSSGGNLPMSRNSSRKERMSKPFLSLSTLSIFKRKDSSSLKSSGVSPPLPGKKKSISKQESQILKVGKRTLQSYGKDYDREKKQPLYDSSKRMKTGTEKGISIPGSKTAEHKHSDAEERDLLHAFSSLYLHCSHHPANRATWKGDIVVHFETDVADYCGGLVARSTGKVHCETYNFSQKLDSRIHLHTLERPAFWDDLFQEDDEEVALYFLCKDVKRLTKYQKLLDLLDEKDLLLISSIEEDVQLLLFSSRLLHPDAKKAVLQYEKGKELATSNGIDFLCGVFLVGAKRVGVHS